MKNIKKLLFAIITLAIILTNSIVFGAGEYVGTVRATPVVAYINNYPIESFNMNNYTFVAVEDLQFYGFDIKWDGGVKSLCIIRNDVVTPTGMDGIFKDHHLNVAHNVEKFNMTKTDVKTYIGNFEYEIPCYGGLPGKTLISFEDLAAFGGFTQWEPEKSKLTLWLDGLHITEPKILPEGKCADGLLQNVYSIQGVKVVSKDEVNSYINAGWKTYPFPITITDVCSFEENSADGIELVWKPQNTSGKVVNYYDVTVHFLNPVGDPAYDEITHESSKKLKYVGPAAPGADLIIYRIVGYVGACSEVVIGEVNLEYSDGTSDSFWCGQVAKEGGLLSKWDGSMRYK